jgi:hypothetical protein
MVTLLITLAVVTLIVLAHLGANAIATGRHRRRRGPQGALRAEDAVEARLRGDRDSTSDAIASVYEGKRGLSGF